MAMGFSTQSGFLYSCSSSFWFTSSCRRSTPMAPASHVFSTFSKAFHRQEICGLKSANCFNIDACASLQFNQSYCYFASRITEETETHPLSCHRQFGAHMEMSMHSTPPWTEPYPYQRNPEKKLLTGKSVILQQNDEEKKCFRGPPAPLETRDCMTTPEMRPSNTDNCTARKRWLIEAQKCKTEVHNGKNGMGIPKQSVEDGISYKIGSLDSLGIASSDNFDTTEALENLWKMDYTLWNQNAHKVQSKSSAEEETFPRKVEGEAAKCSPSVSEGSLLNSKASKELGIKDHGPLDNVPAMYNSVSSWMDRPKEVIQSNGSLPLKLIEKCKERPSKTVGDRITNVTGMGIDSGKPVNIGNDSSETYIEPLITKEEHGIHQQELREKLRQIYDKVLVVDNVLVAKRVVKMLTTQYRDLVHACDTEVANIDVKQETPVDHGEIVCFSIYSGAEVEFGNGKNCIWVDVLDGGGHDMLTEFAPFFGDPSIRKVWHNYSFDSHVIENYGIKLSGFHADTMHMARLWDSSRRTEGGYSLEALTSDPKVCKSHLCKKGDLIGKVSMKTIFGRRKIKKDGSEGKLVTIAPVEKLQKEERIPWICYSALDSINTLQLYESMKIKLTSMKWILDGKSKGSMYDFYEKYWQPFGELLTKMEAEGMLVDRAYLAEVEKVAREEQQIAANRFRGWASRYCPDAIYMNVGSDAQLRQLFFGGTTNRKDPNECLPTSRIFKVPNIDKVIEKGKKVPSKYRNITLKKLGSGMQTEMYTASGWPAVSIEALKMLAGKVSADFDFTHDADGFQSDGNDENPSTLVVDGKQESCMTDNADMSAYGTAYAAFGGDRQGKEACHAIAALCEICAIDSLISNFIIPLQENHISGKNGRIHCSLNINTETGRLSARRPNLQNQPALEKDRYKIRQAFIAAPGNSLIVADYGQLELRILAHLANCKSMLDAFKAGGDFHSRTALNMYPHIREAVEQKKVLLEWYPQPGEEQPPVPLLKDAFASERRKAKMLNFSIAYGKTPVGLSRDWKVSVKEAKKTVDLWYKERREVLHWQEERKQEALKDQRVHTLLGRARCFPLMYGASNAQRSHIERAAINTPVQGSAADVAMCAMLEISRNVRLKELGWRLLLQVHDEVILEGPTESAELAKGIVVDCMSKPFWGTNFLKVDLSVDAKCALNWYAAK